LGFFAECAGECTGEMIFCIEQATSRRQLNIFKINSAGEGKSPTE
jgi:hypothetical protein